MILWIDAQLSPALAPWRFSTFDISAFALRDLGLRDATDRQIFLAARRDGATVMTKDADFVRLLEDLGPPPQVIWIRAAILEMPISSRSFQSTCLGNSRSCDLGRCWWN
jgi:predicted nuclease of predicted toxin-antitoxin system